MERFLKGIICGFGGISPGLSGSVMMVIFGLYEKTIESIGTFFKKPKENFLFLFPVFCGLGIGVLIFGKIISYLLKNFEMQTRFLFLGLVIGTIPLFYRQVKKNNFKNKYYYLMGISFILGLSMMVYSSKLIGQVTTLNFIQSVFLGLLVALSTIVPGIDSSVLLSSLGLYEVYVNSLADLNFLILIPIALGGGIGVLLFSYLMNKLLKKHYTITYTIIFGLFISIIPSVLSDNTILSMNLTTIISFMLLAIGFVVSFKLGKLEEKKP